MEVNITNVLATEQCVILCLSAKVTNTNDRKNIWKNPANYELRIVTAGVAGDPIALNDTHVTYTEEIPAVIILATNAEGTRLRLICKNLGETFDTFVIARSSPANPDESPIEVTPAPDEGTPPLEEIPAPVEVPDPGTEPDEVLVLVRKIDAAASRLDGVNFGTLQEIPAINTNITGINGELTIIKGLVQNVLDQLPAPVNPSLQAIKQRLNAAKEGIQDPADENNEAEVRQSKRTLVASQIALWEGLLPLIQDPLKSPDLQMDMQAKLRLLQSDVNASLGYFYGHQNGIEFFTWQQYKTEALGRINTALARTNQYGGPKP